MDLIRQLEAFQPADHSNRRVDVIGAGATGSHIVYLLAKIGMENIHVWDYDHIESHNVPNQLYGADQVGKLKVEALQEVILSMTETDIVIHPEKVTGAQALGEFVFLLVDTMEARKEIWEKGLKYKADKELVIETRMGADSGRIYAINPLSPTHIKAWEGTLYDDDVATVSACGSQVTVGPTATLISSMAVWQFMNYLNGDDIENEILVATRPWTILGTKFQVI